MIKHFDKEDLLNADSSFRRDFINSITGYKSLHLIGTKNSEGITNLSPFSQVIHVGANPPYIGILFRPHTVKRDTLENILDSQFFTLNHVTEAFYRQAHQTAASYQISEFEGAGLNEEYLNDFFAPFVKESPLKMACTLQEVQTLKVNDTILVVGSIEDVYVKEDAVHASGHVDLNKIGTVTVTGLDEYHLGQKLARLSYPKPGLPLKEI
jgi:flavin reductase (DIM6/NTAB) family NADH-FMN oxidoreductase RutF